MVAVNLYIKTVIYFTTRGWRYQNDQSLGVDGRQTPVSSPASQLHGSRHVCLSIDEAREWRHRVAVRQSPQRWKKCSVENTNWYEG